MFTSKESSRQALSCGDPIRTVREIVGEFYSFKVGRSLWSWMISAVGNWYVSTQDYKKYFLASHFVFSISYKRTYRLYGRDLQDIKNSRYAFLFAQPYFLKDWYILAIFQNILF